MRVSDAAGHLPVHTAIFVFDLDVGQVPPQPAVFWDSTHSFVGSDLYGEEGGIGQKGTILQKVIALNRVCGFN